MRALRAALAVALLGLALGCARKADSKPATFFPESNQVSGWSKQGETRSFAAGDLWRYIDGDAEKYVRAGVQKTLTADYRYLDKVEAVADIHVMGTAEGARKIFDAEPAAGSQPVALGDSARLYGTSLTFRKGPCLVRLVAYQDAPQVGRALTELGRGIEQRLGQQTMQ